MSSPLLQKVDVVSEVSQQTCEALADCLNLFTKQEGVCIVLCGSIKGLNSLVYFASSPLTCYKTTYTHRTSYCC